MTDRGDAARTGSAGSSGDNSTVRTSGHRWRNPLGRGLAISAVLHVIAIVLYSFSGAPAPGLVSLGPPPGASTTPAGGTQIVNLVETPGDVIAPIQPDPELDQVPTDEADFQTDPISEGPVEVEFERRRTAGEVLRPHAEDSIILREVDPALARLTDAEQAQLRVNWMINEWNEFEDSERRAREEALDWTYTDEEGNRWGVSPGKLHLGGVTLPLPSLGVTQGVDPAADRLRRDLAEIEDQAARGLVWENWQRRAAEIRKRKDRERSERLGGQRVDTTGVRR